MSKVDAKREKLLRRLFEILPVLLSWTLLSSPFWASFIAPVAVAYFIIFFDIYFFYRAALLGINALRGYFKIRETIKPNWFQKLQHEGLPWQKMRHIVFIPTYKDPPEILERTLTFLAESEFPTKQINICLATEKREEEASETANVVKEKS